MPIARLLTPFPRRNAAIANSTFRLPIPAVPFSPRFSSPPPPSTAPPPPTPAHPIVAEMAALDPLTLIPSSSGGGVDFELPHAGFSPVSVLKAGTSFPKGKVADAVPRNTVMPQVYPRSVDIHVVSVRGKAPAVPALSSDVGGDAGDSRSPPPSASPPPPPAPPAFPPAEEELESDDAGDERASDTEPAEESELPSDEEEVEKSVDMEQ